MSAVEVVQGIIEIDETISSSCTNSENEVSIDRNERSGVITQDVIDDITSIDATITDYGKEQDKIEADNEEYGINEESTILEKITNQRTTAVKTSRLQYSREELMTLMHNPLSRKWPTLIDPSFQKMQGNIMKIDLDRLVKFTQENKKPSQVSEVIEPVPLQPVITMLEKVEPELKKLKDPKERIKQEEQDGIVLSPQRRSFGTGCRVQHQFPSFLQHKRADSPADCPVPREIHREMPARRIGSGRIVRREDVDSMAHQDNREYRKEYGEAEIRHRDWRMKNDGRYEKYRDDRNDKRRHFYETERMQQSDRRTDKRRMDPRRMGHDYQESAPEWFTGGPSSQNEYIELVGFDEDEKDSHSKGQQKDNVAQTGYVQKHDSRPNTPTIREVEETTVNMIEEKTDAKNPAFVDAGNDDVMQFNIDNIILGDFLDIGSDEVYHSSGQSRLKQFFQDRPSPTQELSSCESSNPLVSMFGFKEPPIEVNSSSYSNDNISQMFPPTDKNQQNSVADIFNQNSSLGRLSAQLNNPPSVNDLLMGGKGQVLQDIEANLCNKQAKVTDLNRNPNQKGAFNDFLSQMERSSKLENCAQTENIIKKLLSGGMKEENVTRVMQNSQPAVPNAPTENDLLAMLIKNGAQSRNQMNGPKVQQNQLQLPFNSTSSVRQSSPTFMASQQTSDVQRPLTNHLSVPQCQNNQDLLMKVLQQQKKQPQLLHPSGFQHQDPLKQLIGGVGGINVNSNAQTQGVLHPDVQMLLQRLASGQVTESQLLVQLASQSVNSQQRDAISTVLKLLHSHHASVIGQRSTLTPSPTPGTGLNLGSTPISLSPRVASPNPEASNMLSAPHVLSQRVSPLMFNTALPGNPRRPPSHQELVAHTQSILQKALIKQELEKAKEKHRKREHERIKSPNPSVNVLSSISNSMVDSRNCGKSQSPLAFTPTSVMRKMTEKDRQEKNSIQEMNRHQSTLNYYPNNTQIMQGNVQNIEAKKEMCNSVMSMNKNFLGPKANLATCGQNLPSNSGHVIQPNRHMMQPPHVAIPRQNQGQHQPGLRGQSTNMHGQMFGNVSQHGLQNRMQGPPPNSIHHLMTSKNNNGYFGMASDLPMAHIGGHPGVNLANLFGRDIVNQAQNGKLPDLPGGQALSLEEVEKLQQSQANKLISCYKYVR